MWNNGMTGLSKSPTSLTDAGKPGLSGCGSLPGVLEQAVCAIECRPARTIAGRGGAATAVAGEAAGISAAGNGCESVQLDLILLPKCRLSRTMVLCSFGCCYLCLIS